MHCNNRSVAVFSIDMVIVSKLLIDLIYRNSNFFKKIFLDFSSLGVDKRKIFETKKLKKWFSTNESNRLVNMY